MQKPIIMLVLLLALGLAACGQSQATAPASPISSAPAATPPPEGQVQPAVAGCTVDSPRPTPGPTEVAIFPPVTGEDWSYGPAGAPVTILVYSDFQCPFCSQLAPELDELQKEFPDEVRVAFRHLPLIGEPDNLFHDKAALAAQAAEAAGEQGQFWEMHDLLFARQSEWSQMAPEGFQEWLQERAAELNLDEKQFAAELVSEENQAHVQAAWDHAKSVGMLSTPFVLVNGQIWPQGMQLTRNSLASIVELNLMEGRQFTACPPMTIDPQKDYRATLHLERGDIVIELLPKEAPIAVNNFIFLARSGWYDGVTFHRVLPGYIAQAGDPSGSGFGGPGYSFVNETSDLKFDQAGLVAMANAGPDTNGSQFFITFALAPNLDGGYTIFGRVIEGLEVAENITPRDPSQSPDLPPGDRITGITIEEN